MALKIISAHRALAQLYRSSFDEHEVTALVSSRQVSCFATRGAAAATCCRCPPPTSPRPLPINAAAEHHSPDPPPFVSSLTFGCFIRASRRPSSAPVGGELSPNCASSAEELYAYKDGEEFAPNGKERGPGEPPQLKGAMGLSSKPSRMTR